MNLWIREVVLSDAEALLKIYTPYVDSSHITFETEVPTLLQFEQKIEKTKKHYPWYLAELEGKIVGYAYASLFRERAAYAWALESSIYLADSAQGKSGIAKLLYDKIFMELKRAGIKQVIGVISLPNTKSVRFHEKMGFQPVGVFPSVGFKLGRWWDVLFVTKLLEPLPFSPPVV